MIFFKLSRFIKIYFTENRLKTKNKCEIDPGVRTFLTVYSKDKVHEIGTNINETLNKYYNKIDKLNERKSKSEIKNKDYKMR